MNDWKDDEASAAKGTVPAYSLKQWALSEAMRDPSVFNSTKDALVRAQEILDWVTKP